jgi:4-amino-4-deoxy-L-arabinose transferase-like glycosyltransferase
MRFAQRSNRPSGLSLLLAALVFFALTLPNLNTPGLYYDEVIFVNAGLGGPLDSFAQTRVLGWPMFIMPYIGSLKSLLHAPLFALFGVNLWTIRIPSLVISFATILLLAGIAKRLAGKRAFIFGLFFFALDPALLWTSRTDFGPTSLAGFFRALSLFAFFEFLSRGGRLRFLLLTLALCLGLWDKLNFIWFLGGLVAAGFLVYPKNLLARFKEGGLLLGMTSLFGVGIGLYFVFQRILPLLRIHQGWLGPKPGLERFRWMGKILSETFDGRGIGLFHFPGQTLPDGGVLWFFLLLILVFLYVLALPKSDREEFEFVEDLGLQNEKPIFLPRAGLFLVLLFTLVAAQIFFTKQSGGLHHMMMLHPLPQLFGFALWGNLGQTPSKLLRFFGRAVLLLAVLAWTFVMGRADYLYLKLLRHPELQSPKWSSSLFELSRRIEGSQFDLVLCTDWGLHAPLFALASPSTRMRYKDFWPKFKDLHKNPKDAAWFQSMVQGKKVLVVLHSAEYEEQKPARANAIRWIQSLPGPTKHWILKHGNGHPLFEVYEK